MKERRELSIKIIILHLMNIFKNITLIRFIHERIFQKLANEIFKTKINVDPEIIEEVLEIIEVSYKFTLLDIALTLQHLDIARLTSNKLATCKLTIEWVFL